MRAVLLALLLLATPALALDPARRDATVISGRLWDGYQFSEMFLPSTSPVLTVVAGQDSAISYVRTQEYYWPLSRQVYVDFETRRDPVTGTLRIERDGRTVAEVPREVYAIDYPQGAVNGNGTLLWGEAAEDAHAAYRRSEIAFNRRFVEAQRAQTAYEQALLQAARAASREAVPAPQPLPEPSLRLVTAPLPGYRIALDPGDYRIALVEDGREIPETRRTLRVISLDGRATLVADILPEERWTRPLPSNTPDARIYVRAGSVFYLTLAEATRFRESDYRAVLTPQAPGSADRDLWVRRKPSDAGTLQMSGQAGAEALTRTGYKVEQTRSSGFGYTVRPARDGETAEIEAFAVPVPASGAGRLRLAIPEAGFTREVVVIGGRSSVTAGLLALVPLLGFLGARLAARRSA